MYIYTRICTHMWIRIHTCKYMDMYMYIYIYIYTYIQTCLSGLGQALQGQGTSRAQSDTDCVGGSLVLPRRCHGKSLIGLPTIAPGKYPPSTGTVRL